MKKSITVGVTLAMAGFIVWFPLGLAYAVFAGLCSLLLGAWARGGGLPLGAIYFAASLAMGLICVVSVCVGTAPGVGTFVFGAEPSSVVLRLPTYGAGQAQYSLWTFFFVLVPPLAGMLLGFWVGRQVSSDGAVKTASSNMP